jgi:hypothetical protein
MKPGDLVFVKNNFTNIDMFGLYLGVRETKWDLRDEFKFHEVLLYEGVKEFCVRVGREKTVFTVIK